MGYLVALYPLPPPPSTGAPPLRRRSQPPGYLWDHTADPRRRARAVRHGQHARPGIPGQLAIGRR